MRFVRIYEQFATQVAGMPVVAGRKSRIESFAGALSCRTCPSSECMALGLLSHRGRTMICCGECLMAWNEMKAGRACLGEII
jgi:hypothetical protein